jgi:uncharacterized protein (DUF983 family)
MLLRGALRRCPRCGSGGVFTTWFRLGERCPRCGLRLERENDFFLGGYVINLAVTEGLLALALLAYVLRLDAEPGTSLVPVLVAGVIISVVLPVLFYPFSRTIWMAIDLAMRPVSREDGEAQTPAAGGGEG